MAGPPLSQIRAQGQLRKVRPRELGAAEDVRAEEVLDGVGAAGGASERRTKVWYPPRPTAVPRWRSSPDRAASTSRWALPEDLEPLRAAVSSVARGEVDVAIFTTTMQVVHLVQVAGMMQQEDAVRAAFRRMVVASIGPTTSEALQQQQLAIDLEASHPKMGFLVRESRRAQPRPAAPQKNNLGLRRGPSRPVYPVSGFRRTNQLCSEPADGSRPGKITTKPSFSAAVSSRSPSVTSSRVAGRRSAASVAAAS